MQQGIQFTHSGARYSLGFDADGYLIWDRNIGPIRRFPRTSPGWAEAWTSYVQLEPANVDLRGGAGATSTRTTTPAEGVPPGFIGYAGFWRRVAAYLIDALLLNVAFVPVNAAIGASSSTQGVRILLSFVVAWLYVALLESSSKQATVGKMALNIVVTDLEGRRISFGRATGRYFGRLLSALILGIGFLMCAWTKRKQCLQDILAGTLVVRRA